MIAVLIDPVGGVVNLVPHRRARIVGGDGASSAAWIQPGRGRPRINFATVSKKVLSRRVFDRRPSGGGRTSRARRILWSLSRPQNGRSLSHAGERICSSMRLCKSARRETSSRSRRAMPSHCSSSSLPQARSSARSISFLSCVLRQFKYHSFPPLFSLHFSRCYALGKFGAAPALLCFRKMKISFVSPRCFGADTLLYAH